MRKISTVVWAIIVVCQKEVSYLDRLPFRVFKLGFNEIGSYYLALFDDCIYNICFLSDKLVKISCWLILTYSVRYYYLRKRDGRKRVLWYAGWTNRTVIIFVAAMLNRRHCRKSQTLCRQKLDLKILLVHDYLPIKLIWTSSLRMGFQFRDQGSSSSQSTAQSYGEVAGMEGSNPYGKCITSSKPGTSFSVYVPLLWFG